MYREVCPPYWFLVNVFADNFCLKTSDFLFFLYICRSKNNLFDNINPLTRDL